MQYTGEYAKEINKHSFSLLAGYSFEEQNESYFNGYRQDFPSNDYTVLDMGGFTNQLNQLFCSRYIGFYLKDIQDYDREQKAWELRKKAEVEREQDAQYGASIDKLADSIKKALDERNSAPKW